MHCNVYPIFVKFVRLTHSNKELLTYLRFETISACDGRTDRQMDGWMDGHRGS